MDFFLFFNNIDLIFCYNIEVIKRKALNLKRRKRKWHTEYTSEKPTRPLKFYATTDNGERMGVRDLRCETIEEAQAVEARYIARGYETKIKEVK